MNVCILINLLVVYYSLKKKINFDIWFFVIGICCCLIWNMSEVLCGFCLLELFFICLVEKNERRLYGIVNERYVIIVLVINIINRRDGKYILLG